MRFVVSVVFTLLCISFAFASQPIKKQKMNNGDALLVVHPDPHGGDDINEGCGACPQGEYAPEANPRGAFVEVDATAETQARARLSQGGGEHLADFQAATNIAQPNPLTAVFNGGAGSALNQLRVNLMTAGANSGAGNPTTAPTAGTFRDGGNVGACGATARPANWPALHAQRACTVVYDNWHYDVDAAGRVVMGVGLITAGANGQAAKQNTRDFVRHVGDITGQTNDDAGHIRARCYQGRSGIINFIPQLPANNQGIQCRIEMMAQALVQDGGCNLLASLEYAYPALPGAGVAIPANFFRPTSVNYKLYRAGGACNGGWSTPDAGANWAKFLEVEFPN